MILCGKKADSKLFDKPKTYILKAMIIYNVTIKVDKRIHDEWLPWMSYLKRLRSYKQKA